jgi:hypothetical protein
MTIGVIVADRTTGEYADALVCILGVGMLIFVAHDFREPPLPLYRDVFKRVEASHDVKFVFGDDVRSANHLLGEIEAQIRDADLCLFDVTTWNINVLLELGLARGFQRPHLILVKPIVSSGMFKPTTSNLDKIPTDLQGLRREQYSDAGVLEQKLRMIVAEYRDGADLSRVAKLLFARVLTVLQRNPDGLSMWDISSNLRLDMGVTRAIVKGLVSEGRIGKTGKGAGTKYHPVAEGEIEAAS